MKKVMQSGKRKGRIRILRIIAYTPHTRDPPVSAASHSYRAKVPLCHLGRKGETSVVRFNYLSIIHWSILILISCLHWHCAFLQVQNQCQVIQRARECSSSGWWWTQMSRYAAFFLGYYTVSCYILCLHLEHSCLFQFSSSILWFEKMF